MPVWNPTAIDYSKGTIIYDPVTGKEFTDDEAKQQAPNVRSRLCLKGKKIGCFVKTIEELRK